MRQPERQLAAGQRGPRLVRLRMALRGVAWRLGHVRRRAAERAARALLRLIGRPPLRRRLPRA
ncbi:MAG TPA: hypothetical protein VMM59_10745, partial [Thermohalobaculum sp.]|nr:hypothetical protein [Thermohalobaculum sp.]